MRTAISIIAESMDEVLRDMDEAAKVADIIELRIDCMANPNLERLLRHSPTPKIVTNRTSYEGGRFQGSEEKRIAYLQEAIALGAEYVDIELIYYRQLKREKRDKTKLIVSHHNLEETPENLDGIYQRIAEKNPDIVKIATKARNRSDNLRMLNLIARADIDIIGICTGPEGGMSRVYGPYFGGYLTFASLSEEKSPDPGMLTAVKLRQVWQLLKLE